MFRLLIFLLILVPVSSAESSALLTLDAALGTLERITTFAFGGVGYAGLTSNGETNLRAIVALPRTEAVAQLKELYREGTPEAKCYALAGLHKLSPNDFRDYSRSAEASTAEVRTMSGCLPGSEKYRDLIVRISKGEFDRFIRSAPTQ